MRKPDWQTDDGSIRLYNADCLDVLPWIEAASVDSFITDLPYGTTANKWDSVIDLPSLWCGVSRALKERGAFITTASQPFTSAMVMSNPGWFRHEWIWIKNRGSNFANTVREPFKEHESVIVFSRGGWTYNPQRQGRAEGGLSRVAYDITADSKSENYRQFDERGPRKLPEDRGPSSWQKFNTEVGLHPTQKPLALFAYLVETYTNEGDIVADVSMGSGTTGLACAQSRRRFFGIEKEPEYFDIACRRIEAELSRHPLFDEPKPKQRELSIA